MSERVFMFRVSSTKSAYPATVGGEATGSAHVVFFGRQAQARQEKLAVLGVPIDAEVRYYERRDRAQPCDHLFRVVELPHMGVARAKSAERA